MKVDKGSTITLPMAGPSTEYDFKYWVSDSGQQYPAGYRFQVNEKTTFSAVWVSSTMNMKLTFRFYYAALLHRKKKMEISVKNYNTGGRYYNSANKVTDPMRECDKYEMSMKCATSCVTTQISVGIQGSSKKSTITVTPSSSISVSVWINRFGNIDLYQSY